MYVCAVNNRMHWLRFLLHQLCFKITYKVTILKITENSKKTILLEVKSIFAFFVANNKLT